MADTGGDENREFAIAAEHGVSAEEWKASKAGWTAKMSGLADMGKIAMAFMPLYQAAQSKARSSGEPCPLETCVKIHAEMAHRKDPLGNQIHYMLALAEHCMAQPLWLECESYWAPRVANDTILVQPNPQFDAASVQRFRTLMLSESDRVLGIVH